MTETSPFPLSAGQRPVIDYPCEWTYTVIGSDQELLRQSILLACAPSEVEIAFSHRSGGGRYLSLKAKLVVESEQMRLSIFEQLKQHPSVRIVL